MRTDIETECTVWKRNEWECGGIVIFLYLSIQGLGVESQPDIKILLQDVNPFLPHSSQVLSVTQYARALYIWYLGHDEGDDGSSRQVFFLRKNTCSMNAMYYYNY